MDITSFLKTRGYYSFEGHTQGCPQQGIDLAELTNKPNMSIMEIGFNAGHSSDTFLRNNQSLTMTSFDLGEHNYVLSAKKYIDTMYPKRHTLIIGDSRTSIPLYAEHNKKFDFIFIDGGHDYEIARADMENCFHLAHKDTIVALDDTVYAPGWDAEWTRGPTKTWTEHVNSGLIVELGRKDYGYGRGMSWGKHVV